MSILLWMRAKFKQFNISSFDTGYKQDTGNLHSIYYDKLLWMGKKRTIFYSKLLFFIKSFIFFPVYVKTT